MDVFATLHGGYFLCFMFSTFMATSSMKTMYLAPHNVLFTTCKSSNTDSNLLGHYMGLCGWYASMALIQYHPSITGIVQKVSTNGLPIISHIVTFICFIASYVHNVHKLLSCKHLGKRISLLGFWKIIFHNYHNWIHCNIHIPIHNMFGHQQLICCNFKLGCILYPSLISLTIVSVPNATKTQKKSTHTDMLHCQVHPLTHGTIRGLLLSQHDTLHNNL